MTTLAPPQSASEAAGEPLLAVACPACHAALAAPGTSAGSPARCPLCRGAFLVPMPPRHDTAARKRLTDDATEDRDSAPIRSTREQKAIRRTRRNLLMLFSGAAILLAIVLLFGARRPKQHR